MTFFPLVPVSACALLVTAGAAVSTDPPPSAFLPPVGQTVSYRYSDAITTPKGTESEAARLTLTTVAGNDIQVTIAVDGKGSRSLHFSVDETGALQPISIPELVASLSSHQGGSNQNEQKPAAQALWLRLSLAARIGAHLGGETSFPVQLNVSWASGPVNPILSIRTTADAFVADARDTTSINPPKEKPLMDKLIAPGAAVGIVTSVIGGTTSEIVGIATGGAALVLSFARGRAGPLPVDVTLHITGQLGEGRLRMLSGDQEEVVHDKAHPRTVSSDKWSLVAG
jgi:hypothetical protein